MENITPEFRLCSNCNESILATSNFCRFCGAANHPIEEKIYSDKKVNLKFVAIFFIIELIFCLSAQLIEDQTIGIAFFYDIAMAISAVIFFVFGENWQENKYLLKWPNFSFPKLLGLIAITAITAVAVNYAVVHLNHFLFEKDFSYYAIYADHPYGNYLVIISVALFPALFEELAYRGFLLEKLLKIVEKKEAIYITSILFFLIHFSVISFFWMLPFAFLLAYVRVKTNTLWYGILIHFFFNLTGCLIEIYQYSGLFD